MSNKKVIITSDSTCDLSPDLIEKYNIKTIPMGVTLGDKLYYDGVDITPDKIYDYSGVLFPEGSLSSDQTLLFDHSQIVRVDHYGLEDQEEKDFKVKLVQIAAAAEASAASQMAARNQ